jgi:CheY-like chemotaxis protein
MIAKLGQDGHEVTLAADGEAGLAQWRAQAFDLILMDVQMPVLDGLEATRRIRLAERRSAEHIPIIAMTANAMAGDRERCLEAGMDEYLAKPFRRTDLQAMIERVVSAQRRVALATEAALPDHT